MKCACSITPVLAVLGLIGLGVGGFNMVRNGCPLGTCHSSETTAVVTAAAATTQAPAGDECPMGCHDSAALASIKTAAITSEVAAPAECTTPENCCKAMSEECCKGKTEADCPAHSMHAVKSDAVCPHAKAPAKDSGTN